MPLLGIGRSGDRGRIRNLRLLLRIDSEGFMRALLCFLSLPVSLLIPAPRGLSQKMYTRKDTQPRQTCSGGYCRYVLLVDAFLQLGITI